MQNLPLINPKLETEKIVNFLKKTFREQKINKVVIGLSGGIDSTVALYLLKKALPPKNIFAVQMDYKPRKGISSSYTGLTDPKESKQFRGTYTRTDLSVSGTNIDLKGINVVDISIKKIVDQLKIESSVTNFFAPMGPLSASRKTSQVAKNLSHSPLLNNIRIGNIMARVRMIILFDLAKQLNALVCGTENKSEKLLGYFTRFGDAASDLEPLTHLYKTQIYQLAKYLNIPNEIINQSPTADLWDGQTDEDDFGFTYEEADQVLYCFERSHGHSREGGNPDNMDPRFHGDDTNHHRILIKKLIKDFPNAEKIIKWVQQNKFKQLTPYYLV